MMGSNKTCKTCKYWGARHWAHGNGHKCDAAEDMARWDYDAEALLNDGFGTEDGEGYVSELYTGPDFGCIHWEAKCEQNTPTG